MYNVKYRQLSPTVVPVLLDGSLDVCERFLRKEKDF